MLRTSGSWPPSPGKKRCAEAATASANTANAATATMPPRRRIDERAVLRSVTNMRLAMKPFLRLFISILPCCLVSGGARARTFTFEAMSGSAYNVPTPLTVQQAGYPEIRFSAHYKTKPFGPYYPYYSWRASLWNERHDQAWEFTQVHHRLFLANNPPEIQHFAI